MAEMTNLQKDTEVVLLDDIIEMIEKYIKNNIIEPEYLVVLYEVKRILELLKERPKITIKTDVSHLHKTNIEKYIEIGNSFIGRFTSI